MPTDPTDLEAGPPTSEPPTDWPDLPDEPDLPTEGEDDGDEDAHAVPPDLLELYEVLEWQAATEGEGAGS